MSRPLSLRLAVCSPSFLSVCLSLSLVVFSPFCAEGFFTPHSLTAIKFANATLAVTISTPPPRPIQLVVSTSFGAVHLFYGTLTWLPKLPSGPMQFLMFHLLGSNSVAPFAFNFSWFNNTDVAEFILPPPVWVNQTCPAAALPPACCMPLSAACVSVLCVTCVSSLHSCGKRSFRGVDRTAQPCRRPVNNNHNYSRAFVADSASHHSDYVVRASACPLYHLSVIRSFLAKHLAKLHCLHSSVHTL